MTTARSKEKAPFVGTQLNPQQQQALARWLQQQAALPGLDGHFTLHKFSNGQSNPSFLLRCRSGDYVLRRQPEGQLLASAHAVDREFRVLQALSNTKVPVPRAIALCEDRSVLGSLFYLMSYEAGDILWDPALPGCKTGYRSACYHALIDTLASLHNVDYQRCGLTDFGKSGNYYARQLNRWTKQYRASETQSITAMDELIYRLEGQLPEDDGQNCLIHGDYRIDNIVFHYQSPQIRAILDWELATLGHPMADLSYYLMALHLPNQGDIRGLAGMDCARLGIPDEQALIARYCIKRGIEPPKDWPFYMAFSFFRLAAILQGVYKRGLDGNASSNRATRMGGLVEPLARLGLQV